MLAMRIRCCDELELEERKMKRRESLYEICDFTAIQ